MNATLFGYLALARPLGWAPFIFALVFGIMDSQPAAPFSIILLAAWVLLCGSIMAVNFYSDVSVDRINTGSKDVKVDRQPFVTGRIRKRSGLLFAAALAAGGLFSALSLSYSVLTLALLFFALQTFYSIGPRLKSVPFIDVLLNSVSVAVSYAVPFPSLSSTAWQPLLWLSFFSASLYMLTLLADARPDRKAGIMTTAVFLGGRKGTVLGFVFYMVSLPFFLLALDKNPAAHYYLMLPFILAGIFAYIAILKNGALINKILKVMYCTAGAVVAFLLVLYLL